MACPDNQSVGMTFEDLPHDWDDHPITLELMPDVVDLFVRDSDRHSGCLGFFLLTEDRYLATDPIMIHGFSPEPDRERVVGFLRGMCETACGAGLDYVLVRGRTGPAVTTPEDEDWFAPVHRELANHLLESYVATDRGVTRYEAGAVA
ncbi:hypothetical protein GCM10028820_10270 [Tessaracoccus terricola]